MRRLKHITYTLLVISLLGIITWKTYPILTPWLTIVEKVDGKKPTEAKVQLAYQLNEDKWTTFSIDTATHHLKLLTNASYFHTYNETIRYAIKVNLLDASGNVLLDKIFYFKNSAKVYREKRSSRILSNPHLIKGGRYITPNLTFLMPLTEFNDATHLKLRQYKIDSVKNIEKVFVRVYSKSLIPKSKRNVLWYRLSPAAKENLTFGNFYPHYMLTDVEKQNILNHSWDPVGPEGNKGDYSVKRMAQLPPNALKKVNLLGEDRSEPNKEETVKPKSKLYRFYLYSGFDGFYRGQSRKKIDAAKKLFIKLFKGATAFELKSDWNKLGMHIQELKRGKRTYTVIYEHEDKLFGRGFYIFCKSKLTRNAALEMPHRFWDIDTGILGYKLMLSGHYVAAAWNTVHRYQTPNEQRLTSDMAHTKNSFFHAFTLAFAEAMPKDSILVQPHGFSNKNQKSYYGKNSAVILSNCTPKPLKQFLCCAKLIRNIMPQPAYIYPLTAIRNLTGLESVAAETLRDKGKKQVFIHMEMNGKTREDMVKDAALRKKFTKCIIKSTTQYQPAQKNEK